MTTPNTYGPVAHLSTTLDWSGAEAYALLLAEGTKDAGRDAFIVAPPESELARRAAAAGVPVDAAAFGWALNPLEWFRLSRILKQRGAAVVHAHDPKAAFLASRMAGMTTAASWRKGAPPAPRWRYANGVSRVLCQSKAARAAGVRGHVPESKLRDAPAGVDIAECRRALPNREALRKDFQLEWFPETEKEKPLIIVAAGALAKGKGHRRLLEAFASVLARLPQCHLIIAGEGDEREDLERQARLLALEDDVTLPGFRDDVPELLAAADVVVAPDEAGCVGTTAMMAMAAGAAVAVTDAGGLGEVVEDGKTGRVAKAGESEGLSRVLLELLENRGQREHLGRMAASVASKRFSRGAAVEAALAAYP